MSQNSGRTCSNKRSGSFVTFFRRFTLRKTFSEHANHIIGRYGRIILFNSLIKGFL